MSSSAPRKTFRTIPNTGRMDGYTNHCMFISILDYLRNVKNINVKLSEIRRIAELDETTHNSMFDITDPRYFGCLDKICRHFRVKIEIYYANKSGFQDERWLGRSAWSFGYSDSVIPIVAYGYHFELIVNIGGNDVLNLIHNPNPDTHVYKPKKDIAFNRKSSDVNAIIESQINILIEEVFSMRETVLLLTREVEYIKVTINKFNDELESKKLILSLEKDNQENQEINDIIKSEINSLIEILGEYRSEEIIKIKIINKINSSIEDKLQIVHVLETDIQ